MSSLRGKGLRNNVRWREIAWPRTWGDLNKRKFFKRSQQLFSLLHQRLQLKSFLLEASSAIKGLLRVEENNCECQTRRKNLICNKKKLFRVEAGSLPSKLSRARRYETAFFNRRKNTINSKRHKSQRNVENGNERLLLFAALDLDHDIDSEKLFPTTASMLAFSDSNFTFIWKIVASVGAACAFVCKKLTNTLDWKLSLVSMY